jgi:hypothetical protein
VQTEPYEVRCHRCQCSFAPGTKQCLHCGGRLGQPMELPFASGPVRAGEGEEGAAVQVPTFARVALWAVSAAIAVGLSALQTCHR